MAVWLKRLGRVLLVVLVLAALGFGYAYWRSESALRRVYELTRVNLPIDGSAQQVEYGAYLARTRGCMDCHQEDLGGGLVLDAGPVGRMYASNLTRGGLGADIDAAAFEHAVRHGVGRTGRALLMMPSADYAHFSDADVAALFAYMQSVPAVARAAEQSRMGPLGRVLFSAGKLPLVAAELIDHAAASSAKAAPTFAATAEYGGYLAQMCRGCHGETYAGGHVPGTPPEFKDAANLTPHASGLANWREADFIAAMRTGKRPDGSEIDPFMPWRQLGAMSDVELQALWAYLSTLPPQPRG